MASYERGWCVSQDINNTSHGYPILSDYIGTPIQFMFKSHVTTSGDSKHKVKYSPNNLKLIGEMVIKSQQEKNTN